MHERLAAQSVKQYLEILYPNVLVTATANPLTGCIDYSFGGEFGSYSIYKAFHDRTTNTLKRNLEKIHGKRPASVAPESVPAAL